MEVSELKIFLAVARNGSISRAAEELHCVQSNVTTRLKQMEERLGASLFHRKTLSAIRVSPKAGCGSGRWKPRQRYAWRLS